MKLLSLFLIVTVVAARSPTRRPIPKLEIRPPPHTLEPQVFPEPQIPVEPAPPEPQILVEPTPPEPQILVEPAPPAPPEPQTLIKPTTGQYPSSHLGNNMGG